MGRKTGKKGKVTVSAGLFIVAAAAAVFLYFSEKPETVKPDDGIFYMSVIDVGQGDSVLLSLNDCDILIDAGDGDSGEKVNAYLEKYGVADIDMLVATHPHSDHIGGMPDVFAKYTVKKILMPELDGKYTPATDVYEKLIDCVTSSKANEDGEIYYAVPGDTYTFGELVLTVLAPYSQSSDYNSDSVVIRAVFGETSFLLTGDADNKIEKKILSSGYTVKSDVLKVGHHGSSSSTGDNFLKAVSPKYAVISCARDNSYGHPHSETLEKLNKYGTTVSRTDISGTVIFTSNGKEVTCHS